METENDAVTITVPSDTFEDVKQAALKAAVGAIVGVAVTAIASHLLKKAQARFKKKTEVIEVEATES